WLELPEQMDALKLFHMALAQGISIAPGPIFSPTRRFGNCIRLNYGSPWHDGAEQAMETLGRIIRSF
ncbi:MAG: PLP-dependent aminotransferase family protein, partial [Pseudomonas alloputida]